MRAWALGYLNLHYVIGGHEADVALHADHLPPIALAGGGLVQDEVLALIEANGLGIDRLEVVQRLEHLDADADTNTDANLSSASVATCSSSSSVASACSGRCGSCCCCCCCCRCNI